MPPAAIATSLEAVSGLEGVRETVMRFIGWLDRFGETSYDYQSYFASRLGGAAKACTTKGPSSAR